MLYYKVLYWHDCVPFTTFQTKEAFPLKYWRGYLVAAIVAACSWGLAAFAKSHWVLVDMIYPYMTRMVQDYLANWSSSVPFCVWQLILIVMGVLLLATVVMMILWKWNPIQWFGWVLAAASIVVFANLVVLNMNDYAGPIAEDLRLEVTDYTISELEEAALFYQEKAASLAQQVPRDEDGNMKLADLETLSKQAADGFSSQTYDHYNAIFSGKIFPVKELGWSDLLSAQGITGITVGITGEAAVNPKTPSTVLPFVVCRQMAQRMCITDDADAAFAAFLACDANPRVEFRYAGYFMAYRYCHAILMSMDTSAAQHAAVRLSSSESELLHQDIVAYGASFASDSDSRYIHLLSDTTEGPRRGNIVDLLVSWQIQNYILPLQEEEVVLFDPLDETQVDLSGLPNVN